MDFETLAPILGTGLGGFVVWAMKRGFRLLIEKQKARATDAVDLACADEPRDFSEGRALAERAGDLFDDQRVFAGDLQAAVQRLSASVEKRDRKIASLHRRLMSAERRAFAAELRLKQADTEIDQAESE